MKDMARSKKSAGGAAAGPSNRQQDMTDLEASHDPQEEHEKDMQGDTDKEPVALNEAEDPDDPDAAFVDDSEMQHSSEANEARQGSRANEPNDEPVLVRCLTDRQPINGHILSTGKVTKMKPSDVRNHRDRGVSLEDVKDDEPYNEDDFVDTSEPYVAEENKERA
jgi:hypothetical protein